VQKLVASVVVLVVASFLLCACGSGAERKGDTSTSANQPEQSDTGSERRVEEFGTEASTGTRDALLAAFRGYLDAIGAHRYRAACSKLSAAVWGSLAQLANGRPSRSECMRVLPALLSPEAAAVDRTQAKGGVTRVRVKGERAFIVFHAPGARLYMMTLVHESGGWKASTATATVLAPSLNTLRR
jgi:hypothetical protein